MKFEKGPFSLVRFRMLRLKKRENERGDLLHYLRWTDLGGIVSLKKVVFVSLELLHFCFEFWLDGN